MIAPGSGQPERPSAAEAAGQGQGLVEVGEADLDRDLAAVGLDLDLVAEGRLEAVGGLAHRRRLLGGNRPARSSRLWLASQLGTVLGLADRPATPRRLAGEAPARVVVARGEQGPAVALAELARLEQGERLVGQLEQADQVGDGGAAAAEAAGELLLGQPQVLDQGSAG